MNSGKPIMIIISGSNGAGKTTTADKYIPMENIPFVNADNIAKGLNPYNLNNINTAIKSGKIAIDLASKYIKHKKSFAIETTLSANMHTKLIKNAKANDFTVVLLFVYIDDVSICIERVADRVENGGHNIPTNDIKRRYKKGLYNLKHKYIDSVDSVLVVDNSHNYNYNIGLNEKAIYVRVGKKYEIINKDIWNDILTKGDENE